MDDNNQANITDQQVNQPSSKAAISRSKIGGEVSIVVSEIAEKCLYTGFFGTIDSARAQQATETILELLVTRNEDYIIIDLSNVDVIDSAVAARLMQIGDTIRVVGSTPILCGISPIVAHAMIRTGISLNNIITRRNLQAALSEIYKLQGLELVKKGKG